MNIEQVCGPTGCCVANDMTDGNNNFDEGEEDTFSGDDELGDCWLYDLGDVSLSTDIGRLNFLFMSKSEVTTYTNHPGKKLCKAINS